MISYLNFQEKTQIYLPMTIMGCFGLIGGTALIVLEDRSPGSGGVSNNNTDDSTTTEDNDQDNNNSDQTTTNDDDANTMIDDDDTTNNDNNNDNNDDNDETDSPRTKSRIPRLLSKNNKKEQVNARSTSTDV